MLSYTMYMLGDCPHESMIITPYVPRYKVLLEVGGCVPVLQREGWPNASTRYAPGLYACRGTTVSHFICDFI